MFLLAVVNEILPFEKRVALTSEVVALLVKLGFEIVVESGAGENAGETDRNYENAGARIVSKASDAIKAANVVVKVNAPTLTEVSSFRKGQKLIALMNVADNQDVLLQLAKKEVEVHALEQIPRITRTQTMDVLSSQANIAGYRAVIEAIHIFARAVPMMTTAAGSIKPAKVFVMGTGVAGLQAIATAKRMGAVVSASDVRPSTKDQVTSLGASFVAVEDEEFQQAQTASGYAKPMSSEYLQKQAVLVKETIANQDIVITTALIPGKIAPILIDDDMLAVMKPGSVIVDLAAASGGNCSQTRLGQTVSYNGVTIVSGHDLTSKIAPTASFLFARNIEKFLTLFVEANLSDAEKAPIRKSALEILEATRVNKKSTATKTATTKKVATKKTAVKKKQPSKKTTTSQTKSSSESLS